MTNYNVDKIISTEVQYEKDMSDNNNYFNNLIHHLNTNFNDSLAYNDDDAFVFIEESIENKRRAEKFNEKILKKYFFSWMKFIKHKKEMRESRTKDDKISKFLEILIQQKNDLCDNKLTKKTPYRTHNDLSEPTSSREASQSSNQKRKPELDYKNYQHRFQAQKNIIALQKAKLEQQKRFIEELKLKKIEEAVGLSADVLKEVKETFSQCDRNLKPKLKCIIGNPSPRDSSSSSYSFGINCMKVPKFLQKMESRAREREERRAIVKERRRQMELEKERMNEQLKIARQIMDQEERNKRLTELKEKCRQEHLIAIRNKKMKEKMRALTVMADLHFEKKITIKYGPQAWKMFIWRVQENLLCAVQHDKTRILKAHFNKWKTHAFTRVHYKISIANNLYHTKLAVRAFREWKIVYRIMINKRQVAEDWYDLRVTDRLFIQWRTNIIKVRRIRRQQWNMAVEHYNTQLKWRAIGCWRSLPTINALEREQEVRKQRWRLKVQQIIPDYVPREFD